MAYSVLQAVGSGRRIDVDALDRPCVFICYAEATQDQATAIEEAVRERYRAEQVLVAHVIDLHSVPRLFRSVAEGILRSEYDKAVAALPPGEDADDYVLILPDWDGAFVNELVFEDVSRYIGVAVFAADGRLMGTAQGDGVLSATLRFVESALS